MPGSDRLGQVSQSAFHTRLTTSWCQVGYQGDRQGLAGNCSSQLHTISICGASELQQWRMPLGDTPARQRFSSATAAAAAAARCAARRISPRR